MNLKESLIETEYEGVSQGLVGKVWRKWGKCNDSISSEDLVFNTVTVVNHNVYTLEIF